MAHIKAWPTQLLETWADFGSLAASHEPPGAGRRPAYLWRGQPHAEWTLRHSLSRALPARTSNAIALEIEERLLEGFKTEAAVHIERCRLPEASDELGWWMLMQHHGAPTRLLDWSASPYVAAYFAVSSHWENDAAVWVIHSHSVLAHFEGLPKRDVPLGKLIKDPESYDAVLPIQAHVTTERTIAQQSHFTLPLRPAGDLTELLSAACAGHVQVGGAATRYIIPAALKPAFLRNLRRMNVTAATLFPGVDGLGRTYADEARLEGEAR